jgi:hypothetical protein
MFKTNAEIRLPIESGEEEFKIVDNSKEIKKE